MASKELFERLPIFKAPMCIISTAKDGTLQLEDEPMKQIEQIDQPLVVVAIAGLYRTGKSYLMNCLAGETKGFPLGNTTESETKGIWAWCRIHPIINNQVLLLLDTEGLGDIAKGNNDHDNKIFTIAALLCNVLVYNMMSTFNQDAIEKLTFISEMSKHIIFANGGNNTDEKFDLILPTFVLCLRDFSLDMKKDGRNLTQDEYLEDCLELKPGKEKEIEKFNRPRDCIRRYFPKRKCFTFDRPGSRAVMKRLETARKEELSEDFLEETEIFLQYMYNCKPKVILGSKPFQGKMFKKLAETYISDIRSGVIPDVDDAIQMVANMENERMANIAVEEFKAKLQAIQLPILQVQKFSNLYTDIQNAILANFRSEAMFESEKFEKRALDEMDKLWNDAKEHNGKLIIEYCHTQLKEKYAEVIGEKRENGVYLVPGGYEDYKYDIENTKRKYKTKMEETEEYIVTQTLNKFIADEADYESEVMINDKKLTEEDRKTEIEMIQRDNQEALLKQQMLFNDMMAAEKQQIQEHYRTLEEDRKAYMEREDQKMNLIMKQWQEEKELNQLQIQMMMNENEKQRNEFKKETKQLHDEMRAKEKENRERYDRLIAQEREFSKLQIDKMNDSMRNMLAISEKREMENMKFMKSVQTSLKDFQKKQVEERRIAENLRREKERFDDLRHQDKLKFEADLQQGRMESNAQRAEIQRLRRQMNNQSSCNVC